VRACGGFPGFRIRMMCATFQWEGKQLRSRTALELGEIFDAVPGGFTGEVVARGFFWD
jgi:hypothetical protein